MARNQRYLATVRALVDAVLGMMKERGGTDDINGTKGYNNRDKGGERIKWIPSLPTLIQNWHTIED